MSVDAITRYRELQRYVGWIDDNARRVGRIDGLLNSVSPDCRQNEENAVERRKETCP